MPTRGIVMVVFGEEYDRLASRTVAHSLRHTSLPITILTNLVKRCDFWPKAEQIKFVHLDEKTNNNRCVKTLLYKYTPYDETLYMDCDAVIQRDGVERIFNYLSGVDIVFQKHSSWIIGKRYYRIYKRTAMAFGVEPPFNIFIGGFWAFKNNHGARSFFDIWNSFWAKTGRGRDMPSLACAVVKSGVNHNYITKLEHKIFSFGMEDDVVVCHRVFGDDLLKKFNIPKHKQNKPFDVDRGDWVKVLWDEPEFLKI